jgi:hypothetical protein
MKGKCPIDKIHRNQCRACRLQKCFEVNMNKNGITFELILLVFIFYVLMCKCLIYKLEFKIKNKLEIGLFFKPLRLKLNNRLIVFFSIF